MTRSSIGNGRNFVMRVEERGNSWQTGKKEMKCLWGYNGRTGGFSFGERKIIHDPVFSASCVIECPVRASLQAPQGWIFRPCPRLVLWRVPPRREGLCEASPGVNRGDRRQSIASAILPASLVLTSRYRTARTPDCQAGAGCDRPIHAQPPTSCFASSRETSSLLAQSSPRGYPFPCFTPRPQAAQKPPGRNSGCKR
jgi:hypothetical protein